MILSKNSFIRNPPAKIDPTEIVIFDAIRYSLDICDISYKRLLKNLYNLTDTNEISSTDFPEIFLDSWSIINSSVIFYKVISREFEISDKEDHFQEIIKAKHLRDSNQHLDERLQQVYKTSDYPIYGRLSWKKNYLPSNKFAVSVIYSGTFTNKPDISNLVSNIIEPELNDTIQQIIFTGVARKGSNKSNYYEEDKVSINRIIMDLTRWANGFDRNIKHQLKESDLNERHQSDLLIEILGEYTGDDIYLKKKLLK